MILPNNSAQKLRFKTNHPLAYPYHAAREENASVKLEKEQEADKKEKQRKEDLLNNSSKLDKVLKDKYSLDGE